MVDDRRVIKVIMRIEMLLNILKRYFCGVVFVNVFFFICCFVLKINVVFIIKNLKYWNKGILMKIDLLVRIKLNILFWL